MSTKLTLRLDEQLIAAAKNYARANGRSLSVLVADYFAQLSGQAQRPPSTTPTAGPITSKLRGALKTAAVTEADHLAHLAAKHR
jgi:uncharacterized protein GlcG (DUF336 family)